MGLLTTTPILVQWQYQNLQHLENAATGFQSYHLKAWGPQPLSMTASVKSMAQSALGDREKYVPR